MMFFQKEYNKADLSISTYVKAYFKSGSEKNMRKTTLIF